MERDRVPVCSVLYTDSAAAATRGDEAGCARLLSAPAVRHPIGKIGREERFSHGVIAGKVCV